MKASVKGDTFDYICIERPTPSEPTNVQSILALDDAMRCAQGSALLQSQSAQNRSVIYLLFYNILVYALLPDGLNDGSGLSVLLTLTMGSYIFLHSRWCDALVSAASNYKDKGGRIDFVCSSREWNISGSTTSLQANGLEFQISIQCRVSISGQQEPIKAQNSKDSLAIELCTASPYRQLKSYFATAFYYSLYSSIANNAPGWTARGRGGRGGADEKIP